MIDKIILFLFLIQIVCIVCIGILLFQMKNKYTPVIIGGVPYVVNTSK